ncbi:Lrp/AsnC family transcriptional regulator [Candidatus Woesearchaeota archaeon]|nr:MAG: Lrp/AsnC family transcriptional regulator [Candidatus Woesearchaeota archaeon]
MYFVHKKALFRNFFHNIYISLKKIKRMLSDSDTKILALLRENSRATIREIAKKIGMRPSTVHKRISQLKKAGVIEKFTVKLNNEKAGEGFVAFILLSTSKELSSSFLNNPHIKEVFGVTGEYDLLVKLKFADASEFNDFLISLRKNTSVIKSLSMIATINLKEEL